MELEFLNCLYKVTAAQVITPAASTPAIIHPTGFQKFAPPIDDNHAVNAAKVALLTEIAAATQPVGSSKLTGLFSQ